MWFFFSKKNCLLAFATSPLVPTPGLRQTVPRRNTRARGASLSIHSPPAVHRDAGLVRGIGTAGLAASIVNSVVGSAIFVIPAASVLEAGAAAPLAYILCAVVMAGVTACFAEAGSRVATSGGAYGIVAAAFGPAAGFVVGVVLVVSDLLASGGTAAAVADMAGAAWPELGGGGGRAGVITCTYMVLVWANLVGVRTTARLITGATMVKLVPLLGFLLLGLASVGHAPPPGPALPATTFAGFGRAAILVLYAFEGMETALGASGEVRAPNRTLPRALCLAMLSVLALYLGVQLSAQHLLGGGLAGSAAPLAEAAGRVSVPAGRVMLAGAGLSMLAWMASDLLGTSRMIFALSRDGRLPAWLGAVHPRTHVPARAVLAYAAVAAVLALTGSFIELVVLSSLAAVAVYVLACLAAVVLRRRRVALAGPPMQVPGLTLAAGVGLAGMAAMVAAARWQEVAGLAGLVAGALCLDRVSRRHGR